MGKLWKDNWEETRQHFTGWWNHTGLVLYMGGKINHRTTPHVVFSDPGNAPSIKDSYVNPEWLAKKWRYNLSREDFIADNLPLASTNIGPGSLALYLGAEPGFAEDTVWYKPNIFEPEKTPPLKFDPENKWWKCQLEIIKQIKALSEGNYFVGCPDIIENIDILSSMRDPQPMMTDLCDRPDWVKEKIAEINRAFFEAYRIIYDIIKLEDGSSCFGPFALWAPGTVAKVQCDASAMFSPAMFEEFVLPSLSEQCSRLDYSMYHLDGTQCICHLDNLLSIKDLDAIEWTPQAGLPGGGDKRWYDLYKRIIKGGKSLQAVAVDKKEVRPLLDSIGTKGVYLQVGPIDTEKEAEEVLKICGR